jgi:hypothetical protein
MAVSFLGAQVAVSGATFASRPAALIANASAHTKGVWTQLIASTSVPGAWLLVGLFRPSVAGDFLVNIGVGAFGTETAIAANIPYSSNVTTSPTGTYILLPLHVPAGSRVAGQCQSTTGSANIDCQVTLFAPMFGGERGLGRVETCGANTGTSLGTTIPGHTTTANTKGTWTPLITSTSFPYKWVCLGITHTNALAALTSWIIDIGVGAGGSEVAVVSDIPASANSTADAISNGGVSFPLSIPAGSRISARCACSVTTASDRDVELVLLGVG